LTAPQSQRAGRSSRSVATGVAQGCAARLCAHFAFAGASFERMPGRMDRTDRYLDLRGAAARRADERRLERGSFEGDTRGHPTLEPIESIKEWLGNAEPARAN